MVRSLVALVLRRVLAWLVWSNEHAKDLEIVVLRHQLQVLRRQVARPRFRWGHRLFLATASRHLARETWRAFLVTPALRGLAVNTAARVLALASRGEVLVSSTTRDLTEGTSSRGLTVSENCHLDRNVTTTSSGRRPRAALIPKRWGPHPAEHAARRHALPAGARASLPSEVFLDRVERTARSRSRLRAR